MNLLVTITYNAMAHAILDPFFACIAAQTDPDFEILVIDNASTDGTVAYLRTLDLPNLHIVANAENIGFGRACNQGVDFARERGATHVTFINNDTEFDPGLIGNMVASLDASDAIGLSPLITYYDEPDRIWFITGSYRWRRGMIPYHDQIGHRVVDAPGPRLRETDFAPGCCLIFRMEAFDAVRGFDDRFFVYWEDADFCLDLKEHGLRVVVDTDLVCLHKVSISTGGAFSDFSIFQFNRGHMVFVRKHFGLGAAAFVVPVVFAKTVLNVLRGRMKPRQFPIWFRGIRSGLAR
ncbi:glycosyltransferase family 2 protein [Sphingomonas faeni]|uniref:glycosyltransferase family 2 protein n=1 Tax=Sphingomonas faeni TaxID=185950 RepID=UPI003355B7A7